MPDPHVKELGGKNVDWIATKKNEQDYCEGTKALLTLVVLDCHTLSMIRTSQFENGMQLPYLYLYLFGFDGLGVMNSSLYNH